MRSILLVKLNHIGDTLILTPTLAFLKARYPACAIDVVVRSQCEGVLQGNPHIRHLLPVASPDPSQRNLTRVMREQLRLLKILLSTSYDYAFDLSNSDRAKLYLLLSGARVRGINRWHNALGWKAKLFNGFSDFAWGMEHQVLRDFRTVTDIMQLTGSPGPLQINTAIALPPLQDKLPDFPWSHPYVVIHPTSRWRFKQWLPDHWATLADRLARHEDLRVIFSIGPAEQEREDLAAILRQCQTQHHAIQGQLSLRELAYVIEHAQLFIGVDTVAMHIAAAVQTPVVALFGPSSEWSWSPWQTPQTLVLGPCHCKKSRVFNCDKNQAYPCMQAITVAQVEEAVQHRLHEARP
ncbi:lipopolysaccharide heptosyltransferase III, putative [Magnetococcus marinus MC-1]|uniref:Lipopolysaccharide heptosyltransferase III, putative n=1 Tax=Magnetococcus marinus (strain ATCC BAA-1437 / JCM 17883 / MC-1) TaxID=156889 RepID=A0LAC2_MAGMM|nr:putative lipopolysaccharide heptosyltransferase III [Magnetococcus marinus]ABK44915.1 lipopolysaccharide heptosyltransferase III, putative [Magnetococcus marinus MC-1]